MSDVQLRRRVIGGPGVALVLLGAGVATAYRVPRFLTGALGVAATYYAMAVHFDAMGSTNTVLHHSTRGLWAALLGFLIAAGGAGLGPRRAA